MIDAEYQIIPLDSDIDINSNDMLVPVGKPKFAYNRQQYLASKLENGVRYEDDGYAAGWYHYKFQYSTDRDDTLVPAIEFSIIPFLLLGQSNYRKCILTFGSFSVALKDYIYQQGKGTYTISRRADSDIFDLSGTVKDNLTGANIAWTASVNIQTQELLAYTIADTNYAVAYRYTGTLHEVDIRWADVSSQITIRPNNVDALLNGQMLNVYTRDASVSKWNGVLQLTDGLVASSLSDQFTVVSQVKSNVNTASEVVTCTVHDNTEYTIAMEQESKSLCGIFLQYSSEIDTDSEFRFCANWQWKEDGDNKYLNAANSPLKYSAVIKCASSDTSNVPVANKLGNNVVTDYAQEGDVANNGYDCIIVYMPLIIYHFLDTTYLYTTTSDTTKQTNVAIGPKFGKTFHIFSYGESLCYTDHVRTGYPAFRDIMSGTYTIKTTVYKCSYKRHTKDPDSSSDYNAYAVKYDMVSESTRTITLTEQTVADLVLTNAIFYKKDGWELAETTTAPTNWTQYQLPGITIPSTETNYANTWYVVGNTSSIDVSLSSYSITVGTRNEQANIYGLAVNEYYWRSTYTLTSATNDIHKKFSSEVSFNAINVTGKTSTTPYAYYDYHGFFPSNALFAAYLIQTGDVMNLPVNKLGSLVTSTVDSSYLLSKFGSSVCGSFNLQEFDFIRINISLQELNDEWSFVIALRGKAWAYVGYEEINDDNRRAAEDDIKRVPGNMFFDPAVVQDQSTILSYILILIARGVIFSYNYQLSDLSDSTYNIQTGPNLCWAIPILKDCTDITSSNNYPNSAFSVALQGDTRSGFEYCTKRPFPSITYDCKLNIGSLGDYITFTYTSMYDIYTTSMTWVYVISGTLNYHDKTTHYTNYINKGISFKSKTRDKNIYQQMIVKLEKIANQSVNLKRTFIQDKVNLIASATIASQANDIVALSGGFGNIDIQNKILTGATSVLYSYTEVLDSSMLRFWVTKNNYIIVDFIPRGIFMHTDGIVYNSLAVTGTQYAVKFTYQGTQYTLTLDEKVAQSSGISFLCRDIRTNEPFREIYYKSIDSSSGKNNFTIKKQQWSSDNDIEKYWWIDQTHILRLTKSDFELIKTTGNIDDWWGDEFAVEKTIDRGSIIEDITVTFGVTSAYNATPVFYKLNADTSDDTNLIIKHCTIAQLFTATFTTVKVPITTVDFGSKLSVTGISAYKTVYTARSILSLAKITTTYTGNYLYIGIHVTNGLKQWTIKISGSSFSVINGYGCVGYNGDLTGGQIPKDFCDKTGFIGTVQAITDLPELYDDVDKLKMIVSDNGSNLWFIKSNITSFVSKINNSVVTEIQLNNNTVFSWCKHSSGFLAMGDTVPAAQSIITLTGLASASGIGSALEIIGKIFSPLVFVQNARIHVGGVVNLAFANFSYIYRTSPQPTIDDEKRKSAGAINFYRLEKSSSVSMQSNSKSGMSFVLLCMSICQSVATSLISDTAVNVANKIIPDTVDSNVSGRQMQYNAMEAALNAKSVGVDILLNGTVHSQLTLDQFYCITDNTQCFAGPGYTYHRLIGQCNVSGMLVLQMKKLTISMYTVYWGITEIVEKAKMYLNQKIMELLTAAAEGVYSFKYGGPAIGAVLQAAVAGMQVYQSNHEAVMEGVKSMVDSLNGDKMNVQIAGQSEIYTVNECPTAHVFGNKSMSFFYPAFGSQVSYTDEKIDYEMNTRLVAPFGVNFYIGITIGSDFGTADNEGPGSANNGNELISYQFGGGDGSRYNINKYAYKTTKEQRTTPDKYGVVEGTTSLLGNASAIESDVVMSYPQFPQPTVIDYNICDEFEIAFTVLEDGILSVSCQDTKIIDGPPTNMVVINGQFCGIASAYCAVEIVNGIDTTLKYLHPELCTPNSIGLNITGVNCVHDGVAYHAFDGQTNRIIEWHGLSGKGKELLYQHFLVQVNDNFKRGSIYPPSQYFGSFSGPPSVANLTSTRDVWYNYIKELSHQQNLWVEVPGEVVDIQRYSIPVLFDILGTLPAVVRTLAPYKLEVYDGITSLTTILRNTNDKYKAPSSDDFNINGQMYRATNEFICTYTPNKSGILDIQDQTPCAGLTFIGATTTDAYFYSDATRLYYTYQGGRGLIQKQDVMSRFDNMTMGRWDFVNQEVVLNAILSEKNVVLRLDQTVRGEWTPPNMTICNERSGYRLWSIAAGILMQGPKRFAINRAITLDYMIENIKSNKKRWNRLPREEFALDRDYGWEYDRFDTTQTPSTAVTRWTHNPWILVTSMLGVDEESDNKMEWALTFTWTAQMDKIYEQGEYAVVNLQAETVCNGGTVFDRPAHVFLYKEMFTRKGNAGYYTYRFTSNNGAGNRERLFIWSDAFVALESIKVGVKTVTSMRASPLVQQLDVQRMNEQ